MPCAAVSSDSSSGGLSGLVGFTVHLSRSLYEKDSELYIYRIEYLNYMYTHIHTLDKNGSLYDPAGTES